MIPHPDCPKCNPKCPCCGTPIKAAPITPTVNPDPAPVFIPVPPTTYPVPFNPYPPYWPWDGITYGTTTIDRVSTFLAFNAAGGAS